MLLSTIREKTKANTKIYRELFGCLPDNKIKTYEKAKDFSREPTLEEYRKLSKSIKGHCVEFPLYFL
jgi:preprotein translocase subunit Sss1